ncbi:hypothetical protein HPB49_004451 [Dermacentor silvarum]|uniref:Uncharacterized protein n=1 Tax=Dermacentor silvarum TaxID=543639 RepID=A0ACB8D2H8_DERSI|nr:hypothetical protein HPB49_004451 [Dermacentor silvarum]
MLLELQLAQKMYSAALMYSFADLALPLAPREQPPAAQKAPAVEARAPKPTKVPQVGSIVESTVAPAVPAVRAPTDSVPPKSAAPSGTQLERVPSVSRLSEEAMDTTQYIGDPYPETPSFVHWQRKEAADEGTGNVERGEEGPDIFECDSSCERITKSGEDYAESSSVEPQNNDYGSNDIIEVDSQTGTEVVGEDDKLTAMEEFQDRKADGDEANGPE